MFLSLLKLNPASADVQKDLRDVQNLHSTIMKAFPRVSTESKKARSQFAVLHRLEYSRNSGWQLYVQSEVEPNWDVLPDRYLSSQGEHESLSVKPVDDSYNGLRQGHLLRFRLRANPTKKVDTKTGDDGKRRNGRRVPLLITEDQIKWLLRKATNHGFELQQVTIAAAGTAELVRSPKTKRTFQGVLYEGVLVVTDVEEFSSALRSGIGSGKAYGFGLLSIGRLN